MRERYRQLIHDLQDEQHLLFRRLQVLLRELVATVQAEDLQVFPVNAGLGNL